MGAISKNSVVYHDSRAVLSALKLQELDISLFEKYPHLDLCTLLRRCFIFTYRSYALNELGSFLGYCFRYPELDGLMVATTYDRHVEYGASLLIP